MAICACPCGKFFEPARSNQVYLNAEHRQKDKNRRWPVKRSPILPVALQDGFAERQGAQASGVTPLLGSEMAQMRLGGLEIEECAKAPRQAGPVMLTTRELAEVIGVCVWTIKDWRRRGVGPVWIKLSARCVRYPLALLLQYLNTHLQGELWGENGAKKAALPGGTPEITSGNSGGNRLPDGTAVRHAKASSEESRYFRGDGLAHVESEKDSPQASIG